MKKIAIIAFLLAVCSAAGRAQESRQDISLSGMGLVEPYVSSQTDVYVSANRALGALASYRFQLTPTGAVEANFGMTYQNNIHFKTNPNNYNVLTRTDEYSGAYVRSFTFRKFNPFIEAGAGIISFSPIRNSGTTTLDAKGQKQMGAIYGGGFAYEISPSFDLRAEFRGIITHAPTFGDTQFTTNKWYNIYNPVIGVAYHF
jgi:opacity protein-like surface antigen